MNFILHEIKLWYKDTKEPTTSYLFKANTVNVITGDSTTGKTSIWAIIDYCLLSGKPNIPSGFSDVIAWYGIRFTINDTVRCIIRRGIERGAVSSDVCMSENDFPSEITPNISISELKTILDSDFGITDEIKYPFGKSPGRQSPLSYRYFLMFNAITESVISATETYVDTVYYGDEYRDKLRSVFNMAIGIADVQNLKAQEAIRKIENKLKRIRKEELRISKEIETQDNKVWALVDKCKHFNFMPDNIVLQNIDDALKEIDNVVCNFAANSLISNNTIYTEYDDLNRQRDDILRQIRAINRYKQELNAYKNNIKKCADSLKPIEFLNCKLQDQLLDSYESKQFLFSLAESLKQIKNKNLQKKDKPLEVDSDLLDLNTKLELIDEQLAELKPLVSMQNTYIETLARFGEIRFEYNNIRGLKTIEYPSISEKNACDEEKRQYEEFLKNKDFIVNTISLQLTARIQKYYDIITSIPQYKGYEIRFDSNRFIVQLQKPGELFPLENIGSKSNYLFLHLCFYLGLHDHMITQGQTFVPQFLFIDQPSLPYYSTTESGNDDKSKLKDAFALINVFMNEIVEKKKEPFQIILIEHASSEYWENPKLSYYEIADEFVRGKGLIPAHIYQKEK